MGPWFPAPGPGPEPGPEAGAGTGGVEGGRGSLGGGFRPGRAGGVLFQPSFALRASHFTLAGLRNPPFPLWPCAQLWPFLPTGAAGLSGAADVPELGRQCGGRVHSSGPDFV